MSVELTVSESIITNEMLNNQRGVRFLYPHGSEQVIPGFEIFNFTNLTIGFRIDGNTLVLATTAIRESLQNWRRYHTVRISPAIAVDEELRATIDDVTRRYIQNYGLGEQEAREFASADFIINRN